MVLKRVSDTLPIPSTPRMLRIFVAMENTRQLLCLEKRSPLFVHPCPVTNASKSCSVPPAWATRVSRRALSAASSSAEGGGAT